MLTSAYFAFAALVTLAASDDVYASTNYHSRCIGAENGDICSVIPFGTRDRYIDADMTVFRQFTPLCGVELDDPNVAFVVQDISHHDASKNRALEIDGGAFWLAAPEPGTHLFNLTLSNRTTGELMDSLLLCMELTLPIGPGSWEQAYNSASDALYARIASSSPDACCPMPHATLAAYASNGPLQYTMDGVLPAGGNLDIKPISIMWIGDTAGFDGMKKFHLDHFKHFPRSLTTHYRLDLMCMERGLFAPMVDAIGDIQQFQYCVSCPRDVCATMVEVEEFLQSLYLYSSFSQFPAVWQSILLPIADLLSLVDAIVLVNDKRLDVYLFHLARIVNPGILRVGDLTTRSRIPDPPTPFTPQPYDLLKVPSAYIGLLPHVTATRIPSYVIPGSVDTRHTFNRSRVLATDTPGKLIPQKFCGGQYRQLKCASGPIGSSNGWCDDSTVFGFLARLSPEKGPGLFMRAASIVLKEMPTAKFVMIGKSAQPVYTEGLLELARLYNITHALKVIGFVPPEDIGSAYVCMDVFVGPYIRPATETFALTNIEAMAMGVPFTHYAIGGIRDYARDGVNSVASDRSGESLAANMLAIATNSTLRQRIIAGGLETASKHFDPVKIGIHGAEMIRRGVVSVRLKGELRITAASVTSVLNLRYTSGEDAAITVQQRCAVHGYTLDCDPIELPLAAPVKSATLGDASVLDLEVAVVPVTIPSPGFDDVYAGVVPQLGGLSGVGKALAIEYAARVLFLEWHSERALMCVRHTDRMSLNSVTESCSAKLRDAVHNSNCRVQDLGTFNDTSLITACSPSIRVALPVGPAKLMVGESTVPFAKVSHRSVIVQVYLPDFVNTTVVHAVSPAPKITAQP